MLGKLYKNEWKEMSRFLLPIHLVALALAVIGGVALRAVAQRGVTLPLAMVFILFATGLFMLLSFGTIFLVSAQYYKTVYSDEGYLTLTLPVTRGQILRTKVVVGSLWVLIDVLIVMGGMISWMVPFMDEIDGRDYMTACNEMGLTPIQFGVIVLVLIVVGAFTSTIMMYTCVSVGQLFHNHKILGAVVSYFVINTVLQVIMLIVMIATGCFSMMMSDTPDFPRYFQTVTTISIAATIIECGGGFFVTKYILDKKVNLN